MCQIDWQNRPRFNELNRGEHKPLWNSDNV